MLGHHDFGQQNTRQKDMNKWIMHLKKELIFGTQPRCILFREETYGILKELLEPGSKNRKKRRGGSRF
jgi:hypothetical protein